VPKPVLDDLRRMDVHGRAGRESAREFRSRDQLDLEGIRDPVGSLDGDEEGQHDQLALDPPRGRMDHERLQPKLGHGIDDGLVRIQVRVPSRSHGLLTRGVQMPDPVLRKVEHDGFERRLVHARTLPTLWQ
jgi:hypothetical protein